MCTATIMDASLFGWYADDTPTQSAVALRKWINDRHGVIAYAGEGQFGKKLKKCGKTHSLFKEYRKDGRAFLVSGASGGVEVLCIWVQRGDRVGIAGSEQWEPAGRAALVRGGPAQGCGLIDFRIPAMPILD